MTTETTNETLELEFDYVLMLTRKKENPLTQNGWRVYSYLWWFRNKGKQTRDKIASELNLGRDTITRCRKELKKLNLFADEKKWKVVEPPETWFIPSDKVKGGWAYWVCYKPNENCPIDYSTNLAYCYLMSLIKTAQGKFTMPGKLVLSDAIGCSVVKAREILSHFKVSKMNFKTIIKEWYKPKAKKQKKLSDLPIPVRTQKTLNKILETYGQTMNEWRYVSRPVLMYGDTSANNLKVLEQLILHAYSCGLSYSQVREIFDLVFREADRWKLWQACYCYIEPIKEFLRKHVPDTFNLKSPKHQKYNANLIYWDLIKELKRLIASRRKVVCLSDWYELGI